MMAGDRVQPWAEFVGFPQTSEVCCGNTEGVLHAVGRSVTVPDQSDAEVIKPVGIAVIDLRECVPITVSSRSHQITVAEAMRADGARKPGKDDLTLLTTIEEAILLRMNYGQPFVND